jgi:uncharacterized protein (TIGR02145 family)
MTDIQIDKQIWASENLKENKFRNGDEIPIVDNWDDWAKHAINQSPCCAYVDNKPSNLKYGLFFNGYCLRDERNICPIDYRLPQIIDILNLTKFLGFDSTRDDMEYYNGDVATGLKSDKLWKKSLFGGPGDNSTKLSFLPGGNLTARDGLFLFDDKGTTASHWLEDVHNPKEGAKYWPVPPSDWNQSRNHKFSIGTGGNNSLSVGAGFLFNGYFIRLMRI